MQFVDTNVLLYAACAARQWPGKRRRALELLGGGDLAFSVQVLQEFYYQATRRGREGRLTREQAMGFLQPLRMHPVQAITEEVFDLALAISSRYQLSYWDGAILAAARVLECDTVYSEDLSHRQDYGGLRVINPFLDGSAGQ